MKRVFSIVALVAMIFNLCACGSKRMDGISDRAYDYGLAALETADEFINGDLDADAASDKLERTLILVDRCDGENDSLVSSSIFLLQVAIDNKGDGTGTMATVEERRDDLADKLGK